jgi:hypothetical protein
MIYYSKMQLRNGTITVPNVIKCCAQKARKTVPYAAKSYVSRDTHDSFSIAELGGMLREFAPKDTRSRKIHS